MAQMKSFLSSSLFIKIVVIRHKSSVRDHRTISSLPHHEPQRVERKVGLARRKQSTDLLIDGFRDMAWHNIEQKGTVADETQCLDGLSGRLSAEQISLYGNGNCERNGLQIKPFFLGRRFACMQSHLI
jgi:hypothetical protein